MKILLDECVDQRFRHLIQDHSVLSVAYMGWSGIRNGRLLAQAGERGFDALTTVDKRLEYQQNLQELPLAVIVLDTKANDMDTLRPLVPALLAALRDLPPRAVTHIG